MTYFILCYFCKHVNYFIILGNILYREWLFDLFNNKNNTVSIIKFYVNFHEQWIELHEMLLVFITLFIQNILALKQKFNTYKEPITRATPYVPEGKLS